MESSRHSFIITDTPEHNKLCLQMCGVTDENGIAGYSSACESDV